MTCQEFFALRGKGTYTLAECAAWIAHKRACLSCSKAANERRSRAGPMSEKNLRDALALEAALLNDPEAASILGGNDKPSPT